MIYLVNPLGLQTQLDAFEHFYEFFTIYKLNWRGTITICFSTRIRRESSGCHNNALVCPSDHGVAEITDLSPRNRTFVPLALEKNLETHERINLKYANPIDPFIFWTASDRYLLESGLSK